VTEPLLARPENELEQALLLGGPADVLAALAAADVFVRTAPATDGLALGTIDHEGATHVAVYSSLARMAAHEREGGDYARLPGRALSTAAPGLGAIVNPGSEVGAVLDADEVAALEETPTPPEPWLLVGRPAHEPEGLLAAVRAVVEREPGVLSARCGLLLRRGASASELVLGLGLEDGVDERPIVEEVARAARAAGVDALALLVLADDDEVSRALVERVEPFFVR
jgi:hypothetical protein